MKNSSVPSGIGQLKQISFNSSIVVMLIMALIFTGIFSCKKTGPAEAVISVRDTNGKAVSGATVVLRQDTVVSQQTGAQAVINKERTTDSQGNAYFSFKWEAVLIVEVTKGTLTESNYIRLEQSTTVEKKIILK